MNKGKETERSAKRHGAGSGSGLLSLKPLTPLAALMTAPAN